MIKHKDTAQPQQAQPCLLFHSAFPWDRFGHSWQPNSRLSYHPCCISHAILRFEPVISTLWLIFGLPPSFLLSFPSHVGLTLGRPGKTNPRPETRTEQPRPISDPTPEICSPESGPETRIELNWTIPWPEIFYKVACFGMTSIFDQKLIDPTLTRTEPYPTQTETTQNLI